MYLKKVKMKTSIASADWSYLPGQVVELDDEIAVAWVEAGHAESLGGDDNEKDGKNSKPTNNRTTKSSGSKKSSES